MDDFYSEELIDAYKNPRYRGKIDKPSVEVVEKNPMCGDEVTLQLDIKNRVIKDAKFHGSACVVSVVSSEFLIDNLIGKSVEEASKIDKEAILKMINLNLTTSRVKCATLALTALKHALAEKKVTRESNMADVLFRHPEATEILLDYGLHCVGCAFSAADTVEEGAKIHKLEDKDIDEMIDRINEVIEIE